MFCSRCSEPLNEKQNKGIAGKGVLTFEIENTNETSAVFKEFNQQSSCNENCKEFHTPRLLSKEAKKIKHISRKMISHVQDLGIQVELNKENLSTGMLMIVNIM